MAGGPQRVSPAALRGCEDQGPGCTTLPAYVTLRAQLSTWWALLEEYTAQLHILTSTFKDRITTTPEMRLESHLYLKDTKIIH